MSDRYNPQDRKFCEFCKCWFANNKISIDNHEKGASHQSNVEKYLTRTRKTEHDRALAERLLAAELQRIENAAMKSFEEDAKRDPFARDELERVKEAYR